MRAPVVSAEAVALLQSGKRFLVTAHARPDGDALGSMLATAHGLKRLGKEVVLYNRDAAPKRLCSKWATKCLAWSESAAAV